MSDLNFKNVAVLMGGISQEREVSLRSGAAVAEGLRQAGYNVAEVDVRSKQLKLPGKIDAAFIALHGEFGEDGQIQQILTDLQIPYTGADPIASRTTFDKIRTKQILNQHNIPNPKGEVLRQGDRPTLPLPLFVKPVRQGSSFGCHCIQQESDWSAAFADALTYNGEALVEAFIAGKELTVGIVDQEALPVIEIRAPNSNYDYKAKYTKGMTEYEVPAKGIPPAVARRAQELSLQTYRAMRCRGMGRVDLRLNAANELFVLELNTIPGFTETSLLPKAARAAGYDFAGLCQRILATASCRVSLPAEFV